MSSVRINPVRALPGALLLILLLTVDVSAQTAFGIRWYGEVRSPAPPKTLALGGIASVDTWGGEPSAVGHANPALTALADRVLYGFVWEVGQLKGEYGGQTGSLWQTGPRTVGLILPLAKGFAVGAGLQGLTTNEFEVHTDGTIGGGVGVQYDYKGTGGLSRGAFTFAWRDRAGVVAVGASADLLLGSIKQEWTVNFKQSGYVSTSDRLQRQHRGHRWTYGIQLQPFSRLRIGGAYTARGDLEVKNIYSTRNAAADTSSGTLRLGETVIAGIGVSLSPMWSVYADYSNSAWNRAEWLTEPDPPQSPGIIVSDIGDLTADSGVGFGVERAARPRDEQVTFFDTMPLRVGMRWGSLSTPDLSGGGPGREVSRWYGTLGTTFQIGSENRVWADVTLLLGTYTSGANARESFWRIQIGITGAERWFLPPQR